MPAGNPQLPRERIPDALLHLFVVVDLVNQKCSERIRTRPGALFQVQNVLAATGQRFLRRGEEGWPEAAATLIGAAVEEVSPAPDGEVLQNIFQVLLEPAEFAEGADGRWALKGSSRLPTVSLPWLLEHRLWHYQLLDGEDAFSTRQYSSRESTGTERVNAYYWDEALDPIVTAFTYLRKLSWVRSQEQAEHVLQRGLRRLFRLPRFSPEVKYRLSNLSRELNELFLGSRMPSVAESQGTRSATLSTGLLLESLTTGLGPLVERGVVEERAVLRNAVGLLYFLRFCKVLRARYVWPHTQAGKTATSEANALADEVTTCCSAHRRLEYSYFLNRIYGSLSEVNGLSFVFRGGILPRTAGGRTWTVIGPPGSGKTVLALQKVASVASRGGLGIYFSFEEPYDLISDRIVSFRIRDNTRYQIEQVDIDNLEEAVERGPTEVGLGLLLLVTGDPSVPFSLLDVIASVGECAWTPWRALAIDSLNALIFQNTLIEGEVKDNEHDLRRTLHLLFTTIESAGFLGVVLCEEGEEALASVPYLSHTLVRLGVEKGRRTRWLKVEKCRGQGFHEGRHLIRISDGEGISIQPSLGAIRSALRRRTKTTLSFQARIRIPASVATETNESHIAEKSSVLLYGDSSLGKSLLAIRLATAVVETRPMRGNLPFVAPIGDSGGGETGREDAGAEESAEAGGRGVAIVRPRAVLVVTFRTSEVRFGQFLRRHPSLQSRWSKLDVGRVRWFSPGLNLSGSQIVWEIWKLIQEHRQLGTPFERIVFDELETLEVALPTVTEDELFLPTLLQMLAAEAVTSFFVLGKGWERSRSFGILTSEVDYVSRASQGADESVVLSFDKVPARSER